MARITNASEEYGEVALNVWMNRKVNQVGDFVEINILVGTSSDISVFVTLLVRPWNYPSTIETLTKPPYGGVYPQGAVICIVFHWVWLAIAPLHGQEPLDIGEGHQSPTDLGHRVVDPAIVSPPRIDGYASIFWSSEGPTSAQQ